MDWNKEVASGLEIVPSPCHSQLDWESRLINSIWIPAFARHASFGVAGGNDNGGIIFHCHFLMISFILNLPYTLFGFLVGLTCLPKKFWWHTRSRALVIEVKSFWWAKGWKMRGLRGTTSGHTILLLSKKIESFDLEHELVHVRQYDDYLIIFPLLYWYELLKNGYRKNKFEDEAYRIAGNEYHEK